MATETKQTWGTRSKKTSVVALGLVAILAGVAVAFFLTRAEFLNNRALGGTLTVEATLPVDFSDEPLYPVNSRTDWSATKDFTVTNNNPVKVSYELFATCLECIPDPGDSPEQAEIRADKAEQFNNLNVRITKQVIPCGATNLGGCVPSITPAAPIYEGKLALLTEDDPAELGTLNQDGGEQTYDIELWLANDPNVQQPQGVENVWEFYVNAVTPSGS